MTKRKLEMVLCGTVLSFLTSKMVELVGVEPMTYTMRTYVEYAQKLILIAICHNFAIVFV